MPVVRIDFFEGRTPEQKKRLAEAITQDFVEILGVDRTMSSSSTMIYLEPT